MVEGIVTSFIRIDILSTYVLGSDMKVIEIELYTGQGGSEILYTYIYMYGLYHIKCVWVFIYNCLSNSNELCDFPIVFSCNLL